ncbi:phage tail protein [Paenibacillus sp. GCM10027627]|uniref:phage tail protein n=1 Tax=unclassified Paenibacillus TaxID=185978 RepID=UPI003642C2E2
MDPYIGEIRMFAGNFAPKDWAICAGQLLPIQRYTALFSILGTMYGGDGKSNFALPNLQGTAPMGQGQGLGLTPRYVGEQVGSSTVALQASEMPMHNHIPNCSSNPGADIGDPSAVTWSATPGVLGPKPYTTANSNTTMNPAALTLTGGSAPHNNMQPYLGINYIISLSGVYPPRG